MTEAFPPQQKDDVHAFDRQVPARQGFEITAARLESGGDSAVGSVDADANASMDRALAVLEALAPIA